MLGPSIDAVKKMLVDQVFILWLSKLKLIRVFAILSTAGICTGSVSLPSSIVQLFTGQ